MGKIKHHIVNLIRNIAAFFGFNLSKIDDYYSPLPVETKLRVNKNRWNKPSSLAGLDINIDHYKDRLLHFKQTYLAEFKQLPPFSDVKEKGFGPGYTEFDSFVLYSFIRDLKPSTYLEVGSGISTYYSRVASEMNNNQIKMICIEPFPYDKLFSLKNIDILKDEVQNIDKGIFSKLLEGDILFIDSSHIVKIDGDVPFLFLEILPILQKGVIIHVHDIPFPYNTPFPAEKWVLREVPPKLNWPMYWNEAMLLQAFLAFNDSFEIIFSGPLIRHSNEEFLKENIDFYKDVKQNPDVFSSIWLRKTR